MRPRHSSVVRTARPLVSLATLAFVLAGCGPEQTAPPVAPTAAPLPPPPASVTTEAPKPARPAFENPGGMWMPQQLADHKETLKSLGLEIDPALLTDPTSSVLGAIVFLGGCSASFVSPDGLIVTNHHCVQGALQYNSTPEKNLIKDGFLAKTRAEERSNGPAARVFVTQAIRDVTTSVLDGLDKITDDRERYKKIESRQKELTAACEKDRPAIRCTVARYFEGASYFQIEQLEIRDIRLVYAPAAGIGNYGGEIDNWRWPRHTGDFGFYRAYVGKDGKPADYSADNVPYKPAHHLKVASKPLAEGDLVLVAGYPGRTSRWKTTAEAKEAIDWFYPRRVASFEEYIALIERLGKTDKELAIKGETLHRGLANYLTNTKGQLEGLVKGGLAAEKEKQEKELRAFIDADPARKAAYGDALDKMAALAAEAQKHREHDATLGELMRFSGLFNAACTLVRIAEERPKADADRDPAYQARNWKRLEQSLASLDKSYNRTLEREVTGLTLERSLRLAEKDRSEVIALVAGKKATKESLAKAVKALYEKNKIEDAKTRVALFQTATTADLKKSPDPLVQLALKVRPLIKDMEERDEKLAGAYALVRPRYVKALIASSKVPLSPDANATLRITYGTVRGYKPTPDAKPYRPFTTLSEVVAKATGQEPFDAPPKLLEAAKAKKLGPYVDAAIGDVPVDFLADLHITGGNSGSATLNARGELTGLVFDGNYEAMASDWVFVPSITRSIHVDLRYMAWIMDAVDGADHLLTEMGITPKID